MIRFTFPRSPAAAVVALSGFVTAGFLLGGCRGGSVPGSAAAATDAVPVAAAPSKGGGGIRFVEVAQKAGLNYAWTAPGKRPLNILQTIGNGAAFLDYDNDNNLDVLLVGPKLALYKGDGAGAFTNVSQAAGLAKLSGRFLGCAVGDVDNDGWDDVYVSGYRTGLLLRNANGKAFQDVSKSFGLKPQPWGTSCGFADLDGDGYLDLYVANYADFGPKSVQLCKFTTADHGSLLSSCGPRYYKAIKGALLHNRGGRTFEDVTRPWGVMTHSGKGLGVAFADFDGSGRVGIAVVNDEVAGNLFQNTGRGKMKDIAVEANTAYDRDGGVHGGMGADWGDYDNDGKPDLFVATFRNEAKSLYRNDGEGLFTDVSYPTGVGQAALPYVAFGTKFLDADNDGWLDLMVANGHVQDNIEKIENATYRQPTQIFRNQGSGANGVTFEDATQAAGLGTLPPIVGRGLATGDYDNDGRVDALVVDAEGKPLLLHNESAAGSWVGFRVRQNGPKQTRDGYGTIITVETNGRKLVRQCQPGGSYLSSSDARVHFGLGEAAGAKTLEQVTVRWPDGKKETWKGVPLNRYLTLTRGKPPV